MHRFYRFLQKLPCIKRYKKRATMKQNTRSYIEQPISSVLAAFKSNPETGLSQEQVKNHQQEYGYNELPNQSHTALSLFIRQFYSPFVYLLLFVAVVAYFLESHFDALV